MTNLSAKDYLFTGVQFLLFVVYIYNFKIPELPQILPDFFLGILLAVGTALCFAALIKLNIYLSPFPKPKSNLKLMKDGIFKYIRHPIYSGLFIGLLSYGLYQHSLSKLVISFLLLIWFYFKSNYEEVLLIQKFPDYELYRKNTGRFLPKLHF